MEALVFNRSLTTILLASLLVMPLFCVCGSAVASPAPSEVAGQSAVDPHACCDSQSPEDQPRESPPPGHAHDPACRHCGEASALKTPEPPSTLAHPAKHVSFAMLAPLCCDLGVLDASLPIQSFARWLADPLPPPDLLRVKCSLQI